MFNKITFLTNLIRSIIWCNPFTIFLLDKSIKEKKKFKVDMPKS